MPRTRQEPRPLLKQPLALAAMLTLVIAVCGALVVVTIRQWRANIVETNMSLAAAGAGRLATEATAYLAGLHASYDAQGRPVITADRDSLDLQLALLATGVFSQSPGLKGGFWMLQENDFMGYANPWSPPPMPVYGPPPRSHNLILGQVMETMETGRPVVRLHQFETMSVSKPVFPLATEPVYYDDQLVGVAWARIHIERLLPAARLTRYIKVPAITILFAFLVVLLMSLYQRRETRSLNENLRMIARDPGHRMARRPGMFGSIREAINRMVHSLEAEHRQRRELEMKLHQQDKMAALGSLLAGVAHELKTPLAILKTRIQILQRDLRQFEKATGQSPPSSDESMQMVLHEIDRLTELLRKLLYFSRPARRELMRRLEADELIRHTVLFVKPHLEEKQIELIMELAAPGGEILGDPDALHQVFLNILTNSIQVTNEGGRISIVTRIDAENQRLAIDLEDTGPGVAPELREQVLTPFYTTRQGGSGLGLAIAYEIIRAHDGAIEFIDPEYLSGAHCRIRLPLNAKERHTT